MCGRYTFIAPASAVEQRFDAQFADAAPTTYNAAPSQRLPIITNAAPGQIQLMSWGLVPSWSRDAASVPRPINTRAEILAEKPSFRQLLDRRRCLVLADSFYEWQVTAAGKVPHRILLRDEQPFAFAGLWDELLDRGTGELHPTFAIVTNELNALMVSIHNRMLVILPDRAAEQAWLADGPGRAPAPAAALRCRRHARLRHQHARKLAGQQRCPAAGSCLNAALSVSGRSSVVGGRT